MDDGILDNGFEEFFVSVCSRLELEREFSSYAGLYCPLCKGKECFLISYSGWWKCKRCKEKGNVWDLVVRLHGQEIGARVLKKYGIGECGALEKETEKLYKWLAKRGKATRSEIMISQGLKAWQMDRIREELGDYIMVRQGGGQRGTKGKVWVVEEL